MRVWPVAVFSLFTFAAVQPPPPPPPMPMQGPARDPGRRPPPEPKGTGVIRGRVITADSGNPVRRATVTLIPMPTVRPPGTPPPPPVMTTGVRGSTGESFQINVTNAIRPRSATTDSQGGFEFLELPAGSYRLQANAGQYQAGYLGISFGGRKPSGPGGADPGTPIQLAAGQSFEKAVIALPRGAAITGRVTDEHGEPMARVQVYTMFFPNTTARPVRMGSGAQTDDLGQFRVYGLAPGEYIVAAEARGNTFVAPNAPPESEEDKIGFLTTFFPSSPDEGGAQRLPVRSGDTPGVEIRMVSGRLFRISGMVTDSQGRPLARGNGSVIRRSASGSSTTNFGFSTDEQGRFQMRNLPPGNYRLTVRQQITRIVNGQSVGSEPGEIASVPLTIASDLEGMLITTGPGATITGHLVFEQGPPPPSATGAPVQMRVMATPGDPQGSMGMPSPQPANVLHDLTFTMKGMMGEYLLRATAPGQYLKSVTAGGVDVTDTPTEFKNGERVTIVLTSRASQLEGNVTDAKGQPVPDVGIVLFSEEKASWRSNSFRTRRSGADANGHYRMPGLMAGRYYIAALPRERMSGPLDAAFFEELAKEATSLVIGEDEQRQVDLKVIGGGG